MAWKIETTEKKCVVDVSYLYKTLKNGKTLEMKEEQGYRWGYVIVEEDPTKAIQHAKESGYPLCVTDLGIIDHSYDDGCWSDREVTTKISKKEQELLDEAWHPQDAGWEYSDDGETYFHGDLEVTNLDPDDEE